jgi:transposase
MVASMAWQPRRLTPAQHEERRLVAARLFARGRRTQAEIARELGVTRQSVSRWFAAWMADGRAGLRARPKSGRPPQIDDTQWTALRAILARGAMAAGFDTERWTLRRIAAVARRDLGIRHHFRSFSRLLAAQGWTPQRPAVQARERDDALVRAWLRRDWPALTKELGTRDVALPSWTRRVTRFGLASAPRGLRPATPPSCAASASGARSRVSSW